MCFLLAFDLFVGVRAEYPLLLETVHIANLSIDACTQGAAHAPGELEDSNVDLGREQAAVELDFPMPEREGRWVSMVCSHHSQLEDPGLQGLRMSLKIASGMPAALLA